MNEIFEAVHIVSALTGSGIRDFEKYLLSKAKPQPWLYAKESHTDQSPIGINKIKKKKYTFRKIILCFFVTHILKELCHELVREKIFKHTNMEIPYSVVIDTVGWTELLDGSLRFFFLSFFFFVVVLQFYF